MTKKYENGRDKALESGRGIERMVEEKAQKRKRNIFFQICNYFLIVLFFSHYQKINVLPKLYFLQPPLPLPPYQLNHIISCRQSFLVKLSAFSIPFRCSFPQPLQAVCTYISTYHSLLLEMNGKDDDTDYI